MIYTASEIAGEEKITVVTTDGTTKVFNMRVGIEGLQDMTAGAHFTLGFGPDNGANAPHPSPHWARTELHSAFTAIANEFAAIYPDLNISIQKNDSSLVRGGRFDIGGTWGGSHGEHRLGIITDISPKITITNSRGNRVVLGLGESAEVIINGVRQKITHSQLYDHLDRLLRLRHIGSHDVWESTPPHWHFSVRWVGGVQ
jgi:hypothetical protein